MKLPCSSLVRSISMWWASRSSSMPRGDGVASPELAQNWPSGLGSWPSAHGGSIGRVSTPFGNGMGPMSCMPSGSGMGKTCTGMICWLESIVNMACTIGCASNGSGGSTAVPGTNSGASARRHRLVGVASSARAAARSLASGPPPHGGLSSFASEALPPRSASRMLAPAAAPSEGDSGGPRGGAQRAHGAVLRPRAWTVGCAWPRRPSQMPGQRGSWTEADAQDGKSSQTPRCFGSSLGSRKSPEALAFSSVSSQPALQGAESARRRPSKRSSSSGNSRKVFFTRKEGIASVRALLKHATGAATATSPVAGSGCGTCLALASSFRGAGSAVGDSTGRGGATAPAAAEGALRLRPPRHRTRGAKAAASAVQALGAGGRSTAVADARGCCQQLTLDPAALAAP
mmetsp:Transcript_45089/g.143642  ORF Transcript_45089/g.143642 Transcript_45089/m.143642 type:complete len:401 (+) Transcript_45089:233-1435(+)